MNRPRPVVLLLSFLSLSATAQVRERDVEVFSAQQGKSVIVSVLDSASSAPLPGATVVFSARKDTVRKATDRFGSASFPQTFGKDFVAVSVSFMGYRTISFRRTFPKAQTFLEVRLAESPRELSSIIIKADAVALVVRGDTTVFSAAAFPSMQGDKLENLLSKLPGISISQGKVFALGRPVSKILVNGIPLFGSNITAGLQMLEADIIKEVKVYDQHPQDRLVEADTLGRKERVLDVTTKKKMTGIRMTQLAAAGGVYTDPAAGEALGSVTVLHNAFNEGKTSLTSNFVVSENLGDNLIPSPVTQPESSLKGALSYNVLNTFRDRTAHSLTLQRNEQRNTRSTIEEAVLAAADPTCRNRQDLSSGNGAFQSDYGLVRSFKRGDRNLFDLSLNAGFSHTWDHQTDFRQVVMKGVSSLTDVHGRNRENSLRTGGSLTYTRRFAKPRRRLVTKAGYQFSVGRGDGFRRDSAALSAAPQWILLDERRHSHSPSVSASWTEPFGKKFSMTFTELVSAEISQRDRPATDRLTFTRDEINTLDYDERRGNLSTKLQFNYAKGQTLHATAGVAHSRIRQTRLERYPQRYEAPNTWQFLSPSLNLTFTKPLFNALVKYEEQAVPPSSVLLRPRVDNASPLFLSAGNPSLKLPVLQTLSGNANLTTAKASSVLQFDFRYDRERHFIGRDILRFDQATPLPEYGYTAPAGAQLSRPVNLEGKYAFLAYLSTGKWIGPLKARLTPRLVFSAANTPYILDGEAMDNRHMSTGAEMAVSGNISSKVEYLFSGRLAKAREYQGNVHLYDAIVPGGDASVRANLFGGIWLKSVCCYSGYHSGAPVRDYDIFQWDETLSWRFGREKQAEVSLMGKDLLNNRSSKQVSLEDQFIRTVITGTLGRSVLLGFTYTFK